MWLIAFLFGYARLSYPEHVRTRLYRMMHAAHIPILSTRTDEKGFSLILTRAAHRRLSGLKESPAASTTAFGGLPVILRSFVFRPGLLLGGAIGIFIFLFCRSRIWEIRIVGDGSIDEDGMRLALAAAGLHEGMAASSLDPDQTVASYLREDGRVAWMQIRREGVIAYVEWIATKGGNESEAAPPDGVGASLVAAYDAVIDEISVERGTPTVRRGEVVRAGDLLVSGMLADGVTYARGEVLGRVRKTVTVTVPFRMTETVSLGEKGCGLRLSVFDLPFSFGFGDGDGDAVYSSHLRIGALLLPIRIEREVRCLTEEREVLLSESEAVRLAGERLAAELAALLAEGELCSRKTEGSFTETGYTLTAEIEYLINIAKTLEFSIENE